MVCGWRRRCKPRARAAAWAHAGRDLGAGGSGRGERLVALLPPGAGRDGLRVVDQPPVNRDAATGLVLATIVHNGCFKRGYPPTWVWTFVYAGVPLAISFLVARLRATADAKPNADQRLNVVRMLYAGLLLGAGIFFVPTPGPESDWPSALTPLLPRAVAAWYALFGTKLRSCAVSLRRPAEAIIPCATLACWSVLLLALPLLHPVDVSGAGPFIGLVAALLALSAYALRIALPARREL
jgi:hypothetical protein